jgi:hypothetical protein
LLNLRSLFFLFLAIGPSGLQAAPSLSGKMPARSESEESELPRKIETGRVLVLVFKNGLPDGDVRLKIAGNNVRPDAKGIATLELAAGTYTVEPEGFGGATPFRVVAGEETEVILNLLPPDQFTGQESAPKAEAGGKKLADQRGAAVKFRVQSSADGKALAAATLLVAGFSGSAVSDEQGLVSLELPAGEYSFSFLHKNAETQVIQAKVNSDGSLEGRGAEAVVAMKPVDTQLEEFVVLAPKVKGSVAALVEIRRSSSAVADVLGSEQMSRQGDGDAAASLRRVTGLTLVGGKYVYVRGLGERYSAVTLNGSSLPSPEPSRRVVPLDLFPTSVLESVVVQKSFTPGLPAEFGGGLIQLKTKSLPDKPFVKAGVSMTLQDRSGARTYAGGGSDWIGSDDGTRKLPDPIVQALRSGKRLDVNNPPAFTDGVSADDLTTYGKALRNTWSPKDDRRTPPPSVSLAAGNRWGNEQFAVGAAASGLYSSNSEAGEKKTKTFNVSGDGALEQNESADVSESAREVKTSATLDVGFEASRKHKVESHLLLVRDTSDEVSVKEYTYAGDSRARRRKTTLEWVERQLFTTQVTGSHFFPTEEEKGVEWEWRASRSRATREAPDVRTFAQEMRLATDPWTISQDANGNNRTWSELEDVTREVGGDLTVPFNLGKLGSAKARAGASYLTRERASDTWRLHFRTLSGGGANPAGTPEDYYGTAGSGVQLTNLTDTADSMSGEQEVTAVHAGLEWEPVPSWLATFGARQEKGRQVVKTFYYFSRNTPDTSAGLVTEDILPAYSLTWKPSPAWRARLAYSETLSRPEFRELSTVPFIDDDSGYETVGNASLRGAVIKNYDHRWEFYPSPEESFSVGVFMKDFVSPIEETFEPSDNLRKTYKNALAARNIGVEAEGRFDLRNLSRFLRRWTLIGNLSVIRSRIELDPSQGGLQTSSERPLQGQSPWIANMMVQYERPAQGTTFSLLYNAVGPRITEVGTSKRPDIYEQPFHQVDFVATQKLFQTWTAGFKARNLLDPESKSTQGNQIVRTTKKGRSLNVSLATAF